MIPRCADATYTLRSAIPDIGTPGASGEGAFDKRHGQAVFEESAAKWGNAAKGQVQTEFEERNAQM